MTFRFTCHRALLVALFVSMAGAAAAADRLSGAWTMTKYEGPATHGTASGLLVFADNHFSLTYTMDESGQRWGRAHAGTYGVSGNKLTYHVRWSMQYVSGTPSVAVKPEDRETTFALTGDTLVVTFSNGSVQTFKRAT
jgi:hypothetical protein